MIKNKQDERFLFDGQTYSIGELVYANANSDYSGLFGSITEIRTGKDKDTDNVYPDFYCKFKEPTLAQDVAEFEERFSKLYGKKMKIKDICLDSVIMSPYMLDKLNFEPDKDSPEVYCVTEEWSVDDESGMETYLFSDKKIAERFARYLYLEERRGGCVSDWLDDLAFCEDTTESSYEAYLEGDYRVDHYCITVKPIKIKTDWQFVRDVSVAHNKENYIEDYNKTLDELFKDEDYSHIGKKTRKKIRNLDVTDKIINAFENNDEYWDSYWSTIRSVCREEIKRIVGEEK